MGRGFRVWLLLALAFPQACSAAAAGPASYTAVVVAVRSYRNFATLQGGPDPTLLQQAPGCYGPVGITSYAAWGSSIARRRPMSRSNRPYGWT